MHDVSKEKQKTSEKEKQKPTSSDKKAQAAQNTMIKVNEAEYNALKKEAIDFKDRWVRLYAEFENVRKRFDRDRAEVVKYANEGLFVDFLSILDDLERTVEVASKKHEDYETFLKGVELVMARIFELLKKYNVKSVDALGKKFDPHLHEVLMQFESSDHGDGEVVEEFQKGYMLGEKVIRTSKVKVAVHSPEPRDEGKDEQQNDIKEDLN